MISKTESRFVKILETDSLTDIAIIKSVLDGGNIKYFIQGENLKFLRPGDQTAHLMVMEDDAEEAIALLKPLDLKYIQAIFGINPRS